MILDNENGKKHIERMELDYFIDAYKYSQGEQLTNIPQEKAGEVQKQPFSTDSLGYY